MANLIVAGAAGRMGRLLVSLIAQDRAHRLVGAVEASGMPALGSDAGTIAGVGALGVPITADYGALAVPGTVTLDFTVAKAALEHLEIAANHGGAIVLGTTGLTPEMEARAREIAPRTRTVIAPKCSRSIIERRLTRRAARPWPSGASSPLRAAKISLRTPSTAAKESPECGRRARSR